MRRTMSSEHTILVFQRHWSVSRSFNDFFALSTEAYWDMTIDDNGMIYLVDWYKIRRWAQNSGVAEPRSDGPPLVSLATPCTKANTIQPQMRFQYFIPKTT